jgi:hypothetical protein
MSVEEVLSAKQFESGVGCGTGGWSSYVAVVGCGGWL